VLHPDNGGPMKGATLLATLERLEVLASFSRPVASNGNLYSEALVRTIKYRSDFPQTTRADLASASAWVAAFAAWYNNTQQHSAISFITPAQRHAGGDLALPARRDRVYNAATAGHPECWSSATRNGAGRELRQWQHIGQQSRHSLVRESSYHRK
jgi:putative transposase